MALENNVKIYTTMRTWVYNRADISQLAIILVRFINVGQEIFTCYTNTNPNSIQILTPVWPRG